MRNMREEDKFIKFVNDLTEYEYEIDCVQDLAVSVIEGNLGGESDTEKLDFLLELLSEYFEYGGDVNGREDD